MRVQADRHLRGHRSVKHERYEPTAPLTGTGGTRGMQALEASAGTGKTFAITSTVLRLVVERDQPFEMDRLLLVTFTRAATAELEDRVRRRLVEGQRALAQAAADGDWSSADEVLQHVVTHARKTGIEVARRRVEEALRTVDQASVTTIHGFCHQVLQQAAVHADSDPGVVIDTDDGRLVTAVVDDWMVRFTHDAGPELIELLDACRLDRDNLFRIGRTVAGEPDPVLAPEPPAADPPGPDLDPLAEVERAMGALRRAVEDPDDTIEAARTAKDEGEITGGSTWAPTDHRLLGRLDRLRGELADGGVPTADTLKGFDPAYVTGSGKTMPERMRQTSVPAAVTELLATRVRIETWIRRRLADDVRTELRRRRELAGTASFADLLRRLAAALGDIHGHALVDEVGGQFDAVLVDEFQDTDPVQWSILRRLFTDTEVFHVVGDPKQAIYGWRGADLQTYLRALGDAETTRTMRTNWRSDAAYVAACNHLLGRSDDSLGGGGVEYIEVEPAHDEPRLCDARGGDAAGMRVTYLPGIGGDNAPAVRERIAEDVAGDIVATLEAGLTLPGDELPGDGLHGDGLPGDELPGDDRDDDREVRRRDLEAADCAVLVRRHREAVAVAEALRRRNVPVVVGGGDDVLLSAEADAMADLLRVLTSPSDDRALRRLLVGPFVGLDGNELARLDEQQDRWQQYAVDVRRWATTWADHGIAAAVQRAIREGEAERRHARRRDGDRTMTNLRHLTELLHRAEQSEALGTHALAAWFDARRAEADDPTLQSPPERELRLERDDAAVQVLTVHAAKGLEFGLVWVPFLWTSDVRSDGAEPFVVNDPDNGHVRTVALHAASSPAVREADPERQRLRDAYERAEWEGGLRLAYVALTRAQHRCTIHLCAKDHQHSLTQSPAWQLFWRDLGPGAPGNDPPPYDEDQLRRELRGLAEHPHIDLEEHAEAPVPHEYGAEATREHPELSALAYGRTEPLDVHWGRASFTGLLRHRAAPAAEEADATDEADTDQGADRHAHGLPELPRADWEAVPPVPLAALPRGAAWGTFLHDVLEHADFGAPVEALEQLVTERARRAAVRPSADDLEVVTAGLHAALATPLGPAFGDLRLADVGNRDRLDELGFTLTLGETAAASFNVGSIANVLERHAGASDAPLAAAAAHLRRGGTGVAVHGLLIGSIDLVLRDDGRFWIADYKSNGLGQWVETVDGERRWVETEAHTTPDRVMAAMVTGDYLLQAHLYTVALHRYLRARLGEAYDYDTHVGGWTYLFLRGMTGDDVARTDGLPHGIATGRPRRELVEDLDALLRGQGVAP